MAKTLYAILVETIGNHSANGDKPEVSPLRQCAHTPVTIDDIPDKYSLIVVDRFMVDRGWLDWHLKDEYKGNPVEFWDDLQKLYEGKNCWSKDGGLSGEGDYLYKKLLNKWGFKAFTKGIAKI